MLTSKCGVLNVNTIYFIRKKKSNLCHSTKKMKIWYQFLFIKLIQKNYYHHETGKIKKFQRGRIMGMLRSCWSKYEYLWKTIQHCLIKCTFTYPNPSNSSLDIEPTEIQRLYWEADIQISIVILCVIEKSVNNPMSKKEINTL